MEYEERLRDSLLDAIADSAAASQLSAQDTPALTMQQASSTTSSAAVSFNVQDVHDLLQQDDSSIPLSSQPELVGEGEVPQGAHVQPGESGCIDQVADDDPQDSNAEQSLTTNSEPVTESSAEQSGCSAVLGPPRSYAPPDYAGADYTANDLPHPLDERRRSEGRYPWYVAWKSRSPGIYCCW